MLMLTTFVYFFPYCYVTGQSRTNFEITKLEKCCPDKGTIQLKYINITKNQRKQYVSYDIMTKIPLDDDVGGKCLIEHAIDGKTFFPLFTVHEKRGCKAANQYLGEFWYNMERAAQLIPGVCPIRAGHYHVHNVLLEFKMIALQTFPFGKLKFTLNLTDFKNRGDLCFCMVAEVMNYS